MTFGTFHGIYYGILKWAYGIRQMDLLPEDQKAELIRLAMEDAGWEEMGEAESQKEQIRELAEEIASLKNQAVPAESFSPASCEKDRFLQIYQAYESRKDSCHKIDFEDMLIRCRDLFLQRPDILKKWQEKFRYILVDEFQDINQVQYDVIRMLASPEDNLFVVGDDDQSIYGFRGARPGVMRQFMKDYPGARTVLLDINYRSTGNIVKSALRVIGRNRNRYDKKIRTLAGTGETVHVQEVKDPLEESRYVAEEIKKRLEQSIRPSRIAVLYRTNVDARALSETLTEYQIPFFMREKIRNIYDHMTAIDISSYFHLAMGDRQRKYFLQVANRPNRYIGRDAMKEPDISYESLRNFYCDKEWMMDRVDQWEWDMKMLNEKAPFAAIQYIRKSMGYDEFLKGYAEFKGLDKEELFGALDEIQQAAKHYKDMESWFAHVEDYRKALGAQKQEGADENSIRLMTVHGAKGLEYDTVFLIHANEGCIPYKKAKTPEEIEEERRLFYVAMTRAKKKLTISYVKEKNGKEQRPSRFAEELFLV